MSPVPPMSQEEHKLQLCLERDRLLCDPDFARSPTMCKLLRFLIDYRLSENTVPLKAYTIAVDALGRDESFDTEIESYPRVQISRLRKMLGHFYLREDSENRLSIPLNQYEIVLEPNQADSADPSEVEDEGLIGIENATLSPDQETQAETLEASMASKSSWFRNKFVIAAVLAVLTLVGFWAYFPEQVMAVDKVEYPTVHVLDTIGLDKESEQYVQPLIKAYLLTSLNKFDQLDVHSSDDHEQHKTENHRRMYSLESSILDGTGDEILVKLTEDQTAEIIWSEQVSLLDERQITDDLTKSVISIAGPYGAIAQAEISKNRDDFSPGYPCILQFHQFIRYRNLANVDPIAKCLKTTGTRFPNDPYVLSMMAIANSIPRFENQLLSPDKKVSLGRRAVQMDRNNASANFAFAQISFSAGDCKKGVTWGKKAVELNPLNSRIMGYLGINMLGCALPKGEEFTARALAIDSNVDLSIVSALAIQMIQRGDAKVARQLSLQYLATATNPEPGLELTYMISTAMMNEKQEARAAWKRLVKSLGLPEGTPTSAVLSEWISDPKLKNEIELVLEGINIR